MSSIKMSPNASGTGIFTVAAPATNTDRTLTLPDQTGTILSNAGPYTANASASNGAVTIDASNNVGIGTSSPAGADGLAAVVYNGGGAARLALKNNSTGNAAGDGFQLAVSGTTAYIEQREAASLVFTTDNTERARIDSSGNLLVNKTSTGYVNGNNLSFELGAGTAVFGHVNGGGTANDYCAFIYNTSRIGGIVQNGASAVSYATSSDYRLKEDIASMTGALAKVSALKPVTYKWKVDGSDGQGFIAHELQAVVPDAVNGVKDAVDADGNIVPQSIDTSFLVATLTAAIQEQQAIIESLTARITALEAK